VAAMLRAADMLNTPRLKAACLAYIARNVDVLVCVHLVLVLPQ